MRRRRAIALHADGSERVSHAHADLRRLYAEVFRPEGDIVLNDGSDDLIVGILEHHAHELADAPELLRLLRIQPRDRTSALGRQEERIEVTRQRRLA